MFKKILISLFIFCALSTHAIASDQYWDGYDDAQDGQGEWSENEDYIDGYEDGEEQRRQQYNPGF